MGVLAAATVIPGAPLHAAGRENYLVAGSASRQGRIVFNAARRRDLKATCQNLADYRLKDSEQAIAILHTPSDTRLTVLACNA